MIQSGDRSRFDVEVLKQLLKLLPEKHEVCTVTILLPHLETCLHTFSDVISPLLKMANESLSVLPPRLKI